MGVRSQYQPKVVRGSTQTLPQGKQQVKMREHQGPRGFLGIEVLT